MRPKLTAQMARFDWLVRMAKFAPLALLALALLFSAAPDAQAQRFSRNLEKIRSSNKGDTVEFVFSHPYQGQPVQEHRAGRFTVTFSGVGWTRQARVLSPRPESIYKEIKVVQNKYSTTVSFLMKDPKKRLKDRISFDPREKVLRLTVSVLPVKTPLSPQGKKSRDVLRAMEERIAGTGAAGKTATGSKTVSKTLPGTMTPTGTITPAGATTPTGTMTPAGATDSTGDAGLVSGGIDSGTYFEQIVIMVLFLLVIIAALYGLLFLYNRFYAPQLRKLTGSKHIKQIASFHIGPRQRIVVLDINGETVACGVTPNQISYLTHLEGNGPRGGKGKSDVSNELAKATGKATEKSAGPDAAQDSEDPEGAANAFTGKKTDSVHHFAQVLKQKVRSLKRIN